MEKEIKQQDWTKVAEIELIYRTKVKASQRPKVHKSSEGYNILLANWDATKIEFVEQFKVMLLNRANGVLGIYEASTGTSVGCIVDPKQIFCCAIKANACSIILCHNHPSGNLKPSCSDEELTCKLKEGGKLLDLKVLDHLIISKDGYLSFADEGLI